MGAFENDDAGTLFSGYPEKVEIKEEKGYRIADIQAVSGTILLVQSFMHKQDTSGK